MDSQAGHRGVTLGGVLDGYALPGELVCWDALWWPRPLTLAEEAWLAVEELDVIFSGWAGMIIRREG